MREEEIQEIKQVADALAGKQGSIRIQNDGYYTVDGVQRYYLKGDVISVYTSISTLGNYFAWVEE